MAHAACIMLAVALALLHQRQQSGSRLWGLVLLSTIVLGGGWRVSPICPMHVAEYEGVTQGGQGSIVQWVLAQLADTVIISRISESQ